MRKRIRRVLTDGARRVCCVSRCAPAARRLCVLAPSPLARSRASIARMPPRRAALQPPPLGRGCRRRRRPPALRAQRRPAVHPRQQHQARGDRWPPRCSRRTDRAHQPLRDRPVVNGVLEGDLVLYGRGDPTLGRRCYAVDTTAPGACETDRSRAMRDAGARAHARAASRRPGDLVGDGSYFEPVIVHPAWEPATSTGGTRRRSRGSASTTTAWT